MRKMIFSATLAVIMIFAAATPAHAQERFEEILGTTATVNVDGYIFEITEYHDANYRVIRTFEREQIPNLNRANTEAAISESKALLSALGKNERMIELISTEDLVNIAMSSRVQTSMAHMLEDEFGNMHYIYGDYAYASPSNIRNFGHIQVAHTAFHLGQGRFGFLTSATWLSMPAFRNFGSIGSIAQTVVIDSMSPASFSYDEHLIFLGNITTRRIHGTAQSQWAAQGDLSGSAAIFNLPSDHHSGSTSVVNTNFTVSISHIATQRHYGSTFNSVGNYTHRTLNFTPSPSISISGFSIGIGVGWGYNVYTPPMLRIAHWIIGTVPGS